MQCRNCRAKIMNVDGRYVHTPASADTTPCLRPDPINTGCANCGGTRGGPLGHETSECIWSSEMPVSNMAVARVVHYVARGSADGRFPAVCRAATVTEVHHDGMTLGLCVVNPTGLFFHPLEMGGVAHHPGDPAEDAVGARCSVGDRAYPGGTWHAPERVQ